MKLSIRESMIPGSTLAERLDWLEDSPYEGLELHGDSLEPRSGFPGSLDMPPDDLVAAFRGRQVRPSMVVGAYDLISPDVAYRRGRETQVRARIDLAARLGAECVIVVPLFSRTPVLPDLSPLWTANELQRLLFVAQLRELGDYAAARDVIVVVEPLNRYNTHFCRTLDDGVRLIEEAGAGPGLGLMPDFAHMLIEETNTADAIRAAGTLIRYVHLTDSNRLVPGLGQYDFLPAFRALKEIGYAGWLGMETDLSEPVDATLREGARVTRELWERA
jgi:sugar phosphate isomerase/epimerase